MATYKNTSDDYIIQPGFNQPATGNVDVVGNVVVTKGVFANYYVGDGQFLSNVTANVGAAVKIQNGTSNVAIDVPNGNITFGVDLLNNLIIVSQLGANITTGTASTSNVTGALIIDGGAGIAGNVYADALFSNNSPVLNGNSIIDGGTY
jgi:hypothetical protein